MQEKNQELNEKHVGAYCIRPHFEEKTKEKTGITLIALIITIIVMMILVGVTVSVVMQGGLFDKATIAVIKQETATMQEYIVTKGADMLADKAKDGDELNVTVEEILQVYGMTLTEINFEETPDYISNVDVDPAGTCYLLDASKLHVDSSRGNGTAQTGKDIFVVDENKRVYYIIEGKIGQGGDIPPEDIPEYDIAKINAVEDLVKLSELVNAGTFEEEYRKVYGEDAEIVVTLERDLNFADTNSYRTEDPTTESYKDAEGNEIDANGDGTPGPIMTEMIGTTADDGTTTGLGFKPIGNIDMQAQEMKTFKGTFEGNGNTIYELYINRPEEMAVGLFGMVDTNITIQNLKVTGNIAGDSEEGVAGGIIGMYLSESAGEINISNCDVLDMNFSGKIVSGILGGVMSNSNITITDCEIAGNCMFPDNMQGGAGICDIGAGDNNNITIKRCINNADISGAEVAGIIVNGGEVDLNDVTIEDCENNGKISGNGSESEGSNLAGIANLYDDCSIGRKS